MYDLLEGSVQQLCYKVYYGDMEDPCYVNMRLAGKKLAAFCLFFCAAQNCHFFDIFLVWMDHSVHDSMDTFIIELADGC